MQLWERERGKDGVRREKEEGKGREREGRKEVEDR